MTHPDARACSAAFFFSGALVTYHEYPRHKLSTCDPVVRRHPSRSKTKHVDLLVAATSSELQFRMSKLCELDGKPHVTWDGECELAFGAAPASKRQVGALVSLLAMSASGSLLSLKHSLT